MKLTTKLGLIFLAVVIVVGAGLGFYGIPKVKEYLKDRELNYTISFLSREIHSVRRHLMVLQKRAGIEDISDDELDAEIKKIFANQNDIFIHYFAHMRARMFVIDSTGRIWQSSDPTKNGVSVNNLWVYNDNTRGRLIKEINERRSLTKHVHVFPVEEIGERSPKTLFVAPLPGLRLGREFYICISEKNSDLFYTANWVSQSLILLLAITILVFYIFFQLFYTRLRKRYDRILEHAQLIAEGNYSTLINDKNTDEIGILAQTIDMLASKMSTEKDFEERHVQTQKMEMIGTLASGIAHDFNNMLGGILSGLDLVVQELKSPANHQSPDVDLIANTTRVTRDCANRGKETVEKLLSFSRKRETHILSVDLNKVLRSVLEICQHSFDKRIKINVQPLQQPAIILADRSLLEQAIMNICINARDAMQTSGKLTLTVNPQEATKPSPDAGNTPAPYYRLKIADTGKGMSEDVLNRIFEPFYTTKEKGTGLGLAMVYKTIDDIGGWVGIDSKVGKGTTFNIYLPIADEKVSLHDAGDLLDDDPTEAPEPDPIPQGREKILVIDDDEFMLQMTEDILRRLGYVPSAAADGETGLKIFAENKDNIDFVILDLMLPDLGGDEIFDKLKELQPNIKVLLISGFKRDPRIADLLVRGCDGFLNKPYSIEDLSKAVRDILDADATPA